MAKKKDFKKVEVERFSTGITVLDCILSNGRGLPGGYPVGKMMTLNSKTKGGKTRIALQAIYSAMLKYGKEGVDPLFLDGEKGMSVDTDACYGYDLEVGKSLIEIDTVEEMQVRVKQFCEEKDPKKVGILIEDSMDSLSTAKTLENLTEREKQLKKEGKIDQIKSYNMDKPKLLSEVMPIMTSQLAKSNTFGIVIQQQRANVNASQFEKKTTVSGGFALPYYTSITFELNKVGIFGERDREVGVILEMFGDKTRTPYERRRCYIASFHGTGFDPVMSDLLFLYDLIDDKRRYDEVKARALKWEDEYDPNADYSSSEVSNEDYKAFAEEEGIIDDIREVHGNIRIGNIKKYIGENKEVFDKFVAKFGVMDIDALCSWIEENDLEEELSRRVADKFYTIEESLLPKNRKSRRLV